MNLMSFLTLVNTAGAFKNSYDNSHQDDQIKQIKGRLNFVEDDLNWLDSNQLSVIIDGQNKLRIEYEEKLAALFTAKQSSLELSYAISSITKLEGFSNPELMRLFLAHIDNISFIIDTSVDAIKTMFDLSDSVTDQLIEIIEFINALKVRYDLSIKDLNISVAANGQLIMKLSEQQLAFQLASLQKFNDLKQDLELINASVDKKLADFGVLSTNTTGVILADGSFKLADTLIKYTGDIFDADIVEQNISSSTSEGNSFNVDNVAPYISNTLASYNGYPWQIARATASVGTLALRSSTKIKKFSQPNDSGVGILLNKPYRLLISQIQPNKDGYLFLKGSGLSEFPIDSITVDYIPSLIRRAQASASWDQISDGNQWNPSSYYVYNYIAGSPSLVGASFGAPGLIKLPCSTAYARYGSIFGATVVQKSDTLIVVKIRLNSNYASVISNGYATGGYVSGKGPVSRMADYYNGVVTAFSYSSPSVSDILGGGSIVVNLPVVHLSFAGVEFAQ